MILDELAVPVVLAPLAGGPSTPALAAAVSRAGGLGFLASGYLSAAELASRIGAARALGGGPLGVNVFAPGSGPAEPAAYAAFLKRLQGWAQRTHAPLGQPRYSDDDWHAKLALLTAEPVEVVSFTFGCPSRAAIDALQKAGSEIWVTVTSAHEASAAEQAGADVLVVQGAEAGGHRASFVDRPDLELSGLLPLLATVGAAVSAPLVASGGIATGNALAAVLCAGARAAQIGTAFMLAPEAGTSAPHRAALRSSQATGLTRAFTGRLARGIRNGFMAEHDASAPVAYPELHYVTAPARQQARQQGNADWINLWAGEAHALARELPAQELVRSLVAQARVASACAQARLAVRQPRVAGVAAAEVLEVGGDGLVWRAAAHYDRLP